MNTSEYYIAIFWILMKNIYNIYIWNTGGLMGIQWFMNSYIDSFPLILNISHTEPNMCVNPLLDLEMYIGVYLIVRVRDKWDIIP